MAHLSEDQLDDRIDKLIRELLMDGQIWGLAEIFDLIGKWTGDDSGVPTVFWSSMLVKNKEVSIKGQKVWITSFKGYDFEIENSLFDLVVLAAEDGREVSPTWLLNWVTEIYTDPDVVWAAYQRLIHRGQIAEKVTTVVRLP